MSKLLRFIKEWLIPSKDAGKGADNAAVQDALKPACCRGECQKTRAETKPVDGGLLQCGTTETQMSDTPMSAIIDNTVELWKNFTTRK